MVVDDHGHQLRIEKNHIFNPKSAAHQFLV